MYIRFVDNLNLFSLNQRQILWISLYFESFIEMQHSFLRFALALFTGFKKICNGSFNTDGTGVFSLNPGFLSLNAMNLPLENR